MEIIYFLPYSYGGVASFVRNLLEFKPKSDIKYKVILYKLQEKNAKNIEIKFNADEIIIFEYSSKENLYSVFKRLKKHISSEKTFIVANDGLEIRMANALKLKNPLIYIVHGDFDYYYEIIKINKHVIDKFITVSNFINTQLQKKGINKNKIITEYVPVKNTQNKEFKNSEKLKLIFVGALIKRKGVQYFKEIIVQLNKIYQNYTLIIVGSGKMEETLKNQFEKDDNVILTGQKNNSEVIEFYLKSDILLFPVKSEGLPVAVVEAMKCGCVPVVSDIPSGIPELIFDGETGYKIPVGDTKQFAEKISYLAQNPEIRIKMAQNAKNHADKMFNPFEQAKKYEQLILNTKPENKIFKKLPLGRVLNKLYLPNFFVKAIRSIIKHPKI